MILFDMTIRQQLQLIYKTCTPEFMAVVVSFASFPLGGTGSPTMLSLTLYS